MLALGAFNLVNEIFIPCCCSQFIEVRHILTDFLAVSKMLFSHFSLVT
jgi:hypothetical protein